MTDDWQIDFGLAHVVEIPLSILLLGDSTNAGAGTVPEFLLLLILVGPRKGTVGDD